MVRNNECTHCVAMLLKTLCCFSGSSTQGAAQYCIDSYFYYYCISITIIKYPVLLSQFYIQIRRTDLGNRFCS